MAYLFPHVVFAICFVALIVVIWAVFFSPNSMEPKPISKKKTRQIARKAVKSSGISHPIPVSGRRYNF